MSHVREGNARHNKLRDLIRYIVEQYQGSSLTRTKLMKLLYIADREAQAEFDEKISDTTYIRYYYGPYSEEAMNAVESLSAKEIRERRGRSSKGDFYIYESTKDTKSVEALEPKEKALISHILDGYDEMDTEELVEQVYEEDDLEDVAKYTEIL